MISLNSPLLGTWGSSHIVNCSKLTVSLPSLEILLLSRAIGISNIINNWYKLAQIIIIIDFSLFLSIFTGTYSSWKINEISIDIWYFSTVLNWSCWSLRSCFLVWFSCYRFSSLILYNLIVNRFNISIFSRSLATHGTLGSFFNWHSFVSHLWNTLLVWLRNLWFLIITHLFKLVAERFFILFHIFDFTL